MPKDKTCPMDTEPAGFVKLFFERNGRNLFWSVKNSGEILNKLKSKGFLASSVSTYDFSTLYTTLPHDIIKEKQTELIKQTFNREGSHYLACNEKRAFFTSERTKRFKLRSCQKVCNALHYDCSDSSVRRVSDFGAGGRGFESRSHNTKGVKNGSSSSLPEFSCWLTTRTCVLATVSVSCNWYD